jgi:ADP-heptose:LPS heptosyltransferase
MYLQRWRALNAAGLSGEEPTSLAAGAHAVIDTHLRRALGITPADDKTYLHFSASATDDLRDLPPQQMVELCRTLHAAVPQLRVVISSNQSERGRAKLGALLTALPFAPWKVFAGALSIPAFASVVQGAALHVGPDSGGLHVARVAGTPSVSWFRPNVHIRNWLPIEPGHQAFVAPESRPEGLHGLDTAALVAGAVSLLQGTHCTVPTTVGDRHE